MSVVCVRRWCAALMRGVEWRCRMADSVRCVGMILRFAELVREVHHLYAVVLVS